MLHVHTSLLDLNVIELAATACCGRSLSVSSFPQMQANPQLYFQECHLLYSLPLDAQSLLQEYIDQHQPEPSLPSAEELRQRLKLGETGSAEAAAAPAGSLGHLMLVNLPAVTGDSCSCCH